MTDLATLVDDLIRRLDREVNRRDEGTAGVGGITLAGTTMESLVGNAAKILCQANGTNIRERLGRVPSSAGAFLRILGELPARNVQDAKSRSLIEKLARDVSQGRRSRLKAMLELRNENAHPHGDPFENATRVMRDLRDWLQRDVKTS